MKGEGAAPTQTLPRLPHEIELQILVRLPVKSLLRFKSVSNQWLSSISDPKFIESHHHRAATRYDTILWKYSDGSLWSLGHDGSVEEFNSFFPTASDDRPCRLKGQPEILGSCNGLLFGLTDLYSEAYCWNPRTGNYVIAGHSDMLHDRVEGYFISGLGYDSSTRDYKAVVAMTPVTPLDSPSSDYSNDYCSLTTYILSFKTRTWKQVGDREGGFPYLFSFGVGTVLDGNPHWVGRFSSSPWDRSVIYFDVVDDSFKELPPPSIETDSMISGLGVMGGRQLCAFITGTGSTPDSSTSEVWAMKEYGVLESWVPLFSIPLFSGYVDSWPLCFTSSNKVLMAGCNNRPDDDEDGELDDGSLFLYDPEAGATTKIIIPRNSKSPSRFHRRGYAAFALEDSFDRNGDPTSAASNGEYDEC